MQSDPKFSICIPCHNHERYIGQTIQSVLDQDFDDFEIIVADNASTDGSLEVAESFSDPRIRVIRNRYNIGFAPNLQQVTRQAKGRFLNVLSSDDLMEPSALRTYSELINQRRSCSDWLVLMSQAWEIDGESRQIQYITREAGCLAPQRTDLPSEAAIEQQPLLEQHRGLTVFAECMRVFNTAGVFCTQMYSRKLWEAVEGYNSTQLINPDMHFILKVLRKNPTVLLVNRPLYRYRRHALGQLAQQERSATLKFQTDQYRLLMQFDDEWLSGTGITCEEQRRLFINRDCLKHAAFALAKGHWSQATRLLAFAWSTYPEIVVRSGKAWALGAALALGPLGVLAANILRRSVRKTGNPELLAGGRGTGPSRQQFPSKTNAVTSSIGMTAKG